MNCTYTDTQQTKAAKTVLGIRNYGTYLQTTHRLTLLGYQMTQLHNIISQQERTKHATNAGAKAHLQLGRIKIPTHTNGVATEIIQKINTNPTLSELFSVTSKTEVPIAGTLNGHFISRRIDRLLIDHATKTIKILDYKTDIDPTIRKKAYVAQINEYAQLLHTIYPTYKISGYILWTHNFLLENIPITTYNQSRYVS